MRVQLAARGGFECGQHEFPKTPRRWRADLFLVSSSASLSVCFTCGPGTPTGWAPLCWHTRTWFTLSLCPGGPSRGALTAVPGPRLPLYAPCGRGLV